MKTQALKGFKDILPDETPVWQQVEKTAREIFHRYGFAEFRVPILEKTELFIRSIGEATDIVEKEMYTFTDRNGASVTMRPEATASVLRAYNEHGMQVRQPVQRFYTMGPMFRHERPQKGRLRQFHQMSVEVLGSAHPRVDSELMAMAVQLLHELGLEASLEINSLGCQDCRPSFKQELLRYLENRQDRLCEDCRRRRTTNPLRVLDCKSAHCQEQYQGAPSILDHLCKGCSDHFSQVRRDLDLLGIVHSVNAKMVRGLDYYSRTTFELVTGKLGAQSAVGAGGRYDGLVRQLGGQDVPGIGFAVGMERLILLLGESGVHLAAPQGLDLFLVALGDNAATAAYRMAHGLRLAGLQVMMDHEGRSLKSQMKAADKMHSRSVLILGDNELETGRGILKNMVRGEQEEIDLPGDDLAKWCSKVQEKLQQLT